MTSVPHHTCPRQDCQCNRVLIVDDEPGILFAYRKLLEQQGIVVDSCDCVCKALNYLSQHQYLAVVADIRLQGTDSTDGLHLIREVRQQQPAAGVIVASGASDEQIRQTASELGVHHYLEKPVNPSVILELLNSLHEAVNSTDQLLVPELCS